MHKIIFSPILLIILLHEVLDVKVMEERKMKVTFQKWIPNIVKRGNNFQVKKKKCHCFFMESSSLYLQAISLGLENHKVKYEQV